MQQTLYALLMILLTVTCFFIMAKLYARLAYSFLIPVLTSTFLIIVILVAFHVPYESYMEGGKWINSLLGPAVVALAFPLYKQRAFLRKHLFLIAGNVAIAGLVGMTSVALFSKWFHLSHSLSLSILPKSVTTPVAMAVADGLGGSASMAIVGVMIAGIFGAMLAPFIFRLFGVESSVGRGIALGSASHALGTSKAAEYNELAFSMGSVSMTLNAILSSLLGPVIALLLFS
ncbi:LrgB family protein [Sporosarcina sp. Te-1]|uniref:LrgB family protein n=1 Tax=Sporosarcina sp. Te-1 TaxID=2818390 RepID=UPI001A9CD35F|nr:LrgB family protein [Sporosarcina sp. Te-1]QTD42967.1 LrgB family protein [Sporosarcina sp. Te-1]